MFSYLISLWQCYVIQAGVCKGLGEEKAGRSHSVGVAKEKKGSWQTNGGGSIQVLVPGSESSLAGKKGSGNPFSDSSFFIHSKRGSEQIRKLMLAGRFRRALPLPGQVPLPWVSPLRTGRSGSLSSMLLTPFTKVVPTFFHPSFFSWHPRNFLDFSREEIIKCSGMGTVFHLVL